MKSLFSLLLLGIGLFLTASVSYASTDGTKTSKECSFNVESILSIDSIVYGNIDENHVSFDFLNENNSYSEMEECFSPAEHTEFYLRFNKNNSYSRINYWLLYKHDLLFKSPSKTAFNKRLCNCRSNC